MRAVRADMSPRIDVVAAKLVRVREVLTQGNSEPTQMMRDAKAETRCIKSSEDAMAVDEAYQLLTFHHRVVVPTEARKSILASLLLWWYANDSSGSIFCRDYYIKKGNGSKG